MKTRRLFLILLIISFQVLVFTMYSSAKTVKSKHSVTWTIPSDGCDSIVIFSLDMTGNLSSGSKVKEGDEVYIQIYNKKGFEVKGCFVNNKKLEEIVKFETKAVYNFIMPKTDVEIRFDISNSSKFALNYKREQENGITTVYDIDSKKFISPNETVLSNTNIVIIADPDKGSEVLSVKANGNNLILDDAENGHSKIGYFKITEPTNIDVEYSVPNVPLQDYNITFDVPKHCSIAAYQTPLNVSISSPAMIKEGRYATFYITPEKGYYLTEARVNDKVIDIEYYKKGMNYVNYCIDKDAKFEFFISQDKPKAKSLKYTDDLEDGLVVVYSFDNNQNPIPLLPGDSVVPNTKLAIITLPDKGSETFKIKANDRVVKFTPNVDIENSSIAYIHMPYLDTQLDVYFSKPIQSRKKYLIKYTSNSPGATVVVKDYVIGKELKPNTSYNEGRKVIVYVETIDNHKVVSFKVNGHDENLSLSKESGRLYFITTVNENLNIEVKTDDTTFANLPETKSFRVFDDFIEAHSMDGKSYRVISMDGKVLLEGKIIGGIIRTATLPQGIYILSIESFGFKFKR